MFQSVKAIINADGQIILNEPVKLKSSYKAIVVILEEEVKFPNISETALLSEQSLAKDWRKPEEDEAWSHLQ